MDQSNLINFIAGLFGGGNTQKSELVQSYRDRNNSDELTGVARYIKKNNVVAEVTQLQSGVSKYLDRLEPRFGDNSRDVLQVGHTGNDECSDSELKVCRSDDIVVAINEHQGVDGQNEIDQAPCGCIGEVLILRNSSVTRYLDELSSIQVSGVTKYLAKRVVEDRYLPKATSVDKYFRRIQLTASTNIPKSVSVKSGVEKYVEGHVQHLTTSVSKYLLNQSILERKNKAKTKVSKYLDEELAVQKKVLAERIIAKYIEEQEIIAKQLEQEREKAKLQAQMKEIEAYKYEQDMLRAASTNVSRYILSQEFQLQKKPPVSGVAKYISRQVTLTVDIKRPTGVERYMVVNNAREKPVLTGVEKYLKGDVIKSKSQEKAKGVSKVQVYVAKQDARPKPSRVSKYLLERTSRA